MSRATIDRPYAGEHTASMARKAVVPKNLLGWFLTEFRAEMPDTIHASGVWREYVVDQHRDVGGGSLLGTPRWEDQFRRFIEDTPFAVGLASYDGQRDRIPHYVFPLRAALARLAGRGQPHDERPWMARCLHRIALRDGDWQGACTSLAIPEPVQRVYIDAALAQLWRLYQVEPSVTETYVA